MTKPCEHCRKPFQADGSARYCPECRHVSLLCQQCWKPFRLPRRLFEANRNPKFCSVACRRQHPSGMTDVDYILADGKTEPPPPPPVPVREFETVPYREAAQRLGLTEGEVWTLVQEGELLAVRVDDIMQIERESLERFAATGRPTMRIVPFTKEAA